MRSSNVAVFVCWLVLSVGSVAVAQEEFTPQEAKDFKGQYSVGIGLAGFTSSTDYVMADDHGIGYDVMSLLRNPAARERIGVSEDHYAELSDLQAELKSKMESMHLSVYAEEERDKLKALFFETEAEMLQGLNAEQLSMLKFERARNGIKVMGPSYLAEPEIASSLGITVEAAKLIGERSNSYRQQMKTLKLNLLKEANEKLIESLTAPQLERMGDIFDERTRKQFLETALFAEGKLVRRKSKPWAKKYLSWVGLNSVQRKLSLSQGQLQRIDQLEEEQPELEKSIADILTPEQLHLLDRRGVRAGVRKPGTVNLMTDGLVGQKLDLNDEEKDRMFELGKELHTNLESQMEQASKDWAVKEFGPDEDQAKQMTAVMGLIGE